jgi:hypothetical protein
MEKVNYQKDCSRMQTLSQERGYDLSLEECYNIWKTYSDSLGAGWLCLSNSDDNVFSIIKYNMHYKDTPPSCMFCGQTIDNPFKGTDEH